MIKPPISVADLPEGWIDNVRQAMNVWDGVPVRASTTSDAIEVYSINRDRWLVLMLPGGGHTFATTEERNGVLKLLTEKRG